MSDTGGIESVYGIAVDVYRAAGWESVLPLPAGRKTPPPEGFTGRYGRVPTEENYQDWKVRAAHGNICVRLPDDVIGIDVDNYSRKTGEANLEQFTADNELPSLPPTWTSSARSAPSGIRWYRVPAGTRFVPEVCRDVEVIQAGHRYAVVWPSMHPDGSEYQWRDQLNRPSLPGDVPHKSQLAELPSEWVDALRVIGGSTGAGPREGRLPDRTDVVEILEEADRVWDSEVRGAWKNNYERVWQRFVESARVSTRHSAMLRATAIVVGDVLAGAMPGRAVQLLADDCCQAYEDPVAAGLGLKDSKPWPGPKEADFWSQVAGALAQYNGEWSERIEETKNEVTAVSTILEQAVGQVKDELRAEGSITPGATPEVGTEGPVEGQTVAETTSRPEIEAPVADDRSSMTEPMPAVEGDVAPAFVEEDDDEVPEDLLDWLLGPQVGLPATTDSVAAAGDVEAQTAHGVVAEAMAADEGRGVDALDADPRVWEAFIRLGRRWVADETETTERLHKALMAGLPIANEAIRWMPEVDRRRAGELWAEARQVVQTADRLVKPGSFVGRVLPHYVDDDWIPESCVVTLVAPPSGGKTAIAVDMACKVAIGARWFGHRTDRTPVLFLAFEAEVSTRNRIAGWCEANRGLLAKAPDEAVVDGQPAWLYMTGMETPLSSEAGLMVIESQLAAVKHETGEDPGMIFVDTLAASFGGGDENSARDMHMVLDNIARLRAAWPRLTIVLLHHPTKDSSRFAFSSGRGSGALRGTAQVELSTALVEGTDQVKLGRTKSRDGRAGDDVYVEGHLKTTRLRAPDGTWLKKPDGAYAETVVFIEANEADRAARASEMVLSQARAEQARIDAIWAVLEEIRTTGAGSLQADAVRKRVKELYPGVELGATAEARQLVADVKRQHKAWLAGLAPAGELGSGSVDAHESDGSVDRDRDKGDDHDEDLGD